MRNFIQKSAIVGIIWGMTACSVYHQDTTDVQHAVDSNNRVKVETVDNLVFELRELRREDSGQLVGITGKKSDAAKLFLDRNNVEEGKFLKIPFQDNEIRAVYLKNRKMSNIVNFGVPVMGVVGIVGLTNPDFRPDVGY
ncbi:hypothetical protein [Salinimicrobium oceani]|uniref:Lipoprotein n=1 Tax=Salinimicrobium oceani TaxID=2722702 RepID=A0ABX1D213_9FLAO|nr:hypothetical protein [Salinimicrobium oceani]NJW53218.1 hypothetical protein [Salinimicrobium oceani]